jgi:integrase/recombinase XerD
LEETFSFLHEFAKGLAVDSTKILTGSEIARVIDDLTRKGKRSLNTRQNRIIFRLATCCGLRVSEICGLEARDVILETARPHIQVRAEIAKRKRARKVPLWWDAATLADLASWRPAAGPLVRNRFGAKLSVRNAQARYKAAIKVLGRERQAMVSIHCGRHSFCSHALAGGRSLPEVRDAAGHRNIATTSIYLHAIDDGAVGNLFAFACG